MNDKLSDYDFADFGSSHGGSLNYARKIFNGKHGVGIDIDSAKVDAARSKGLEVIQGDLTQLEFPDDAFRFVTMMHFLEHLPTLAMARKCILTGVRTAREFVFIRQPWFSSDGYLASLGLKQYWSDWHGHPNRMDLLAFYQVLRQLPKDWEWDIYARSEVHDSTHSCIHPLSSPIDQHDYNPDVHPQKPVHHFTEPVFKETVCFIYRPDIDAEALAKKVKLLKLLQTSKNSF